MWYVYTVDYYSAVTKNENAKSVGEWNQKKIVLSEIPRT